MSDSAVALGQLVDGVLRETTFGQRLAAAAGEPLRPEHRRWISALCMLGALEADSPEALLVNTIIAALRDERLGGRTTGMREADVQPLLNAIVSPTGLALDESSFRGLAKLRSNVLLDEIGNVVGQMDALGPWTPWPGLSRVRGDQRGLCQRMVAGIVSLLRPIAGARCATREDLERLHLVTRATSLHGFHLGHAGELPDDAVLLEAEPSSGKTRLALAYGVRLWRAGHVDGITWVLPTRRAAVHVYDQIAALLPAGNGPLAVLGLWAEGTQSDDRRWFLDPSYRYFAAPICITTMEQAYKAIRPEERHGYTRAAWLARNLLVVDSLCHADSRNLCASAALMRNQRRVGGRALALSSGLDTTARNVVNIFTRDLHEPLGVDPKPVSLAELPHALSVPAAAVWSCQETVSVKPPALPRRNTQSFTLRLIEPEDHPVEEIRAYEMAADGLRVLRVCNTNRLCRTTAMRVLESAEGASVIMRAGPRQLPVTYRSRYPASDLQCIDAAAGEHFDLSRRRNGCLLVATGLVDHSVDLSFDIVISDFAPADILFRRMALLSRGPRASWRPAPELHVLMPFAETLADVAAVYEDVEAVERTHLHLANGAISFDSRELLERAYVGSLGRGLQRHLARARWLAPETHMLAFGSQTAGTEPDPLFPHGEPRQRIAFERGVESPLGIPLLPMWIRVDEQLSSTRAVSTYRTQLPTATMSLDVLAWDGQLGHRLSSLGYWYSTEERGPLDVDVDDED